MLSDVGNVGAPSLFEVSLTHPIISYSWGENLSRATWRTCGLSQQNNIIRNMISYHNENVTILKVLIKSNW